MKTTHLRTRSERGGKIGRGERRVVSPGKWKFDDGSAQRKKGRERERESRGEEKRRASCPQLLPPALFRGPFALRVIRSKSFNPIVAAFHLIAFSMLLAGVITLTSPGVKQGNAGDAE